MIIAAQRNVESVEGTRARYEKDLIVAFHTEDVATVLKANYEARKDASNGWTKDRHFRKIASFTELGYQLIRAHHPDIIANEPKERDKAWKKALMCAHCNQYGEGQYLQVPASTL